MSLKLRTVIAASCAAVLISAASPISAASNSTLCAAQSISAGNVAISNTSTTVTVIYTTLPGFVITETHTHVSGEISGLPQTRSKNPQPGQFAKKSTHSPGTSLVVQVFPMPDGADAGETIYVAAHAVVAEAGGDPLPVPYPADVVVSANQGDQFNGDPVVPQNSIPESALEYGDGAYYTLGVGGSITVEFNCPVTNGPGVDFQIWEDTCGVAAPETANVSVSEDGIVFVPLGTAHNDRLAPSSIDQEGAGGCENQNVYDLGLLSNIRFVRVVDSTTATEDSLPTDDGFDIEAIKSYQACTPGETGETETAWGGACGVNKNGVRFTTRGNWGTYVPYLVTN